MEAVVASLPVGLVALAAIVLAVIGAVAGWLAAQGVTTTSVNLALNYVTHTAGSGIYYTVSGDDDVHVAAGRPIQPRASQDVHINDTIVHGVLMLGGAFYDQPIDPLISRIVTEELYLAEPTYHTQQWYPVLPGSLNRFLAIDGQSRERLIVVPGQFKATSSTTSTLGTQRLYSQLEYLIYHAPFTATDFVAPNIWQVEALSDTHFFKFRVQVSDDKGSILRAVVLYRTMDSTTWSKAELPYYPSVGWAEVLLPPISRPIEYFAQVVDATGNVAVALDHGVPFTRVRAAPRTYLPLIMRQ